MQLPVMPPVAPMLAKAVGEVPPGMAYEAKWDGFRAVIFRDGDEVVIGSRNSKPLTRYFPEVVDAALSNLPARCVVDGEIIIVTDNRLDFDALLQRIHPAASRVELLARQTPASFVAFDLLAVADLNLMEQPFRRRRQELVTALAAAEAPVYLAPATDDVEQARQWFVDFEGAGLDGVMAKSPDGVYQPGKRAMFKIKHERTADCVVAGFRWHKSGPVVGSLLLGLYDDSGILHQVGVSASFPMAVRQDLVALLAPYRLTSQQAQTHPWSEFEQPREDGESVRVPGAASRWNSGRDLSWQPLVPELVAEVAYDHMQGNRFRHTAGFRRWRSDRQPDSCTFAQLEHPLTMGLERIIPGVV
ncbi:MAG: ATP-dependent DNA ligase [Actinomycetes bacterium]